MKKRLLIMLFFSVLIFQSCKKEKTPQACFTYTDNGGMSGHYLSFKNCSTNAYYYEWNFGNGDSRSTVKEPNEYFSSGTYTVTLTVFSSSESKKDITTQTITLY